MADSALDAASLLALEEAEVIRGLLAKDLNITRGIRVDDSTGTTLYTCFVVTRRFQKGLVKKNVSVMLGIGTT